MQQAPQDEDNNSYRTRCIIADPGRASHMIESTRDDDRRDWVGCVRGILCHLCAFPTPGPSPATIDTTRDRSYREVLEAAGIPYDGDVRGRITALDDLVAVWRALEADPDALEAARAYVKVWPPSRPALASLAIDIAFPYIPLELGYSEIVARDASRPPAALVAFLGDTARTAAREHATAERWRFQGPTASCADDTGGQFLLVHFDRGPRNEGAILVHVARGDTVSGAGTLVGRMCRQYPSETAFAFNRLGVPTGAPLPPPVRPYAGFVPVLLAAVLDAHDEDETDYFSQSPDIWRRTPCIAVRSLMRVAVSPAAIPPAIMRAHVGTLGFLPGTRYAWLGGHELIRLLAAAAGSHVASLARLVPAHADMVTAAPDERHDDDTRVDHGLGRRLRYDGVTTTRHSTCPPTLAAQSRAAIVRSGARVPLALLPTEIADPLAFDIWLAECAVADAAWNGSSDDREASDSTQGADRLLDVATHWGVQPTAAQERKPHSLCGALAHVAVARGMRGGAQFVPDSVARVGLPLLTDDEHAAIATACSAPKLRRFLWTPDPAGLVDRVFDGHEWLSEIGGVSFVHDVVDRARALVVAANDTHNVRPDHPSAADAIEPRVQILIAIAALRSGLADLQVDDLADAGAASTRLGPLAALFP